MVIQALRCQMLAQSMSYKCVKRLEKCWNRQTHLSEAITGLRPCTAAVSRRTEELQGSGWALGGRSLLFSRRLRRRQGRRLTASIPSTCGMWDPWQPPLLRCCRCGRRLTPAQPELVLGNRNLNFWRARGLLSSGSAYSSPCYWDSFSGRGLVKPWD